MEVHVVEMRCGTWWRWEQIRARSLVCIVEDVQLVALAVGELQHFLRADARVLDQSSQVPLACRVVEGVGLVTTYEDLDEVVLEFEPELRCCGAISTIVIQRVGGMFMKSADGAEEMASSSCGIDGAFYGCRCFLLTRHLLS